jgi:hypothetical protein
MQYNAKSNKNYNGNTQIQSVIITAVALFALAGAILGFSVGALTHSHSASNSQANNNNNNATANKPTKPGIATTPTISPTPTALPLQLGCPLPSIGIPLAGPFTNIFTLQVMDKTGNKKNKCYLEKEKPITSNGVTCRIWLTKANSNGTPQIEADDQAKFQDIAHLTKPLPHEIENGLQFDSTTPQTQPCVNGLGKWNITLSPSLSKNHHYYIVGLTSNGMSYNWSWSVQLTAK